MLITEENILSEFTRFRAKRARAAGVPRGFGTEPFEISARIFCQNNGGISYDAFRSMYKRALATASAPKADGGGNGGGNGIGTPEPDEPERKRKTAVASKRYELAATNLDILPDDRTSCFLLGLVNGGLSKYRERMTAKGFEFKKLSDSRWLVTQRPEPPKPVPPTLPPYTGPAPAPDPVPAPVQPQLSPETVKFLQTLEKLLKAN